MNKPLTSTYERFMPKGIVGRMPEEIIRRYFSLRNQFHNNPSRKFTNAELEFMASMRALFHCQTMINREKVLFANNQSVYLARG